MRWFDTGAHALPGDLADWWSSARAQSAAPVFEVAAGERRLRARLVRGADEDLLIVTEPGNSLPQAAELGRLLPITRREADVLARLAAGRTNDGIAHDLGISRPTVVRHVERIYTKLAVRTRAAATRAALEALHDA